MSGLVFPHTFVPWFRSVAPYIHAYRGETFVVGMPGELVAAGKLNAFVQDLSILHAMGIKIVLVHGFRPQVNEQLAAKGQTPRYSHGRRITDAVALDCAQEAAGQLRFEIEAAFSQGLPNTPMANATVRVVSGNFLTARPVGIVDGVPLLDLEYVEDVACDTDMNVVMTASGGFVELQGTAEGHAFRRDELDALLAAGLDVDTAEDGREARLLA